MLSRRLPRKGRGCHQRRPPGLGRPPRAAWAQEKSWKAGQAWAQEKSWKAGQAWAQEDFSPVTR
ncbi:MAG: hypothetical protein QOJ73_426 [Streptosporangiaceae bacterium]|jgi:hypothetical protein|nr:hypothetical protein [Streptosporangiaceae bacterium]